MITPAKENLIRVTVTLDPVDVDLLDRLGRLEGLNRSAELRSMLAQLRPMLQATVEAFEAAERQRMQFDEEMVQATVQQLEAVMPELDRMQRVYMGAVARLEGAAAAESASEDPRPSNHGGQNPQPPSSLNPPESGSEQ